MSLTTAAANAKVAAIHDAFDAVGGPGTTDMPALPRGANKNTEELAWEVLVSKQLQKDAETRVNAAIKAAIAGGVMFDHKKAPHEPETACVVYNGAVVRIDLAVGTGRSGVNHDLYVAGLVAAKVDPKLLSRLALNCVTTAAPPHSFTAVLVTK